MEAHSTRSGLQSWSLNRWQFKFLAEAAVYAASIGDKVRFCSPTYLVSALPSTGHKSVLVRRDARELPSDDRQITSVMAVRDMNEMNENVLPLSAHANMKPTVAIEKNLRAQAWSETSNWRQWVVGRHFQWLRNDTVFHLWEAGLGNGETFGVGAWVKARTGRQKDRMILEKLFITGFKTR